MQIKENCGLCLFWYFKDLGRGGDFTKMCYYSIIYSKQRQNSLPDPAKAAVTLFLG